MTDRKVATTNIVALLTILILSAVTMMWLFWHFPLVTGLVTLCLSLAFGLSARSARSIDPEVPEMDHREHIVG